MKKTQKVVFGLALIALIAWGIWISVKPDAFEVFEQELGNELQTIKATYGLTDLSYITQEWKENIFDSSLFSSSVDVYCDGEFSEFEPSKQYEVMKAIKEAMRGAEGASECGDVSLLVNFGGLHCGEDTYNISSFEGTLDMNSECIYTDPEDHERYLDYKRRYNDSSDSSSGSLNSYSAVSSSDDDYWNAVTAAQELVKEKLKSPSTSKFPSGIFDTSYSVLRSGKNWMIGGYVDAQNGFGATVRSNWIVTFTMGDTSGSKYKVSNYEVTIY